MAPLYDRLVPILQVADLQAERDFYVALGFTVSYEGPEFPRFRGTGAWPHRVRHPARR